MNTNGFKMDLLIGARAFFAKLSIKQWFMKADVGRIAANKLGYK